MWPFEREMTDKTIDTEPSRSFTRKVKNPTVAKSSTYWIFRLGSQTGIRVVCSKWSFFFLPSPPSLTTFFLVTSRQTWWYGMRLVDFQAT